MANSKKPKVQENFKTPNEKNTMQSSLLKMTALLSKKQHFYDQAGSETAAVMLGSR
ncbi:hypothetical protein ACFTAO_10830 [Paenibacillus rhizoplanae]